MKPYLYPLLVRGRRRRILLPCFANAKLKGARSLACPLLTLSSARPFSNGIFRSNGARASRFVLGPAVINTHNSLPPASSSLTHARRMDGFCNQSADQLGSLAGPSLLTVYVGVVECAPASPPPPRPPCTVVVFSLLVGARRRSVVLCGAERSGAERSDGETEGFCGTTRARSSVTFNGMRKGNPLQPLQLVAFHH
jgi:hypothetical protein